MATLILLAVNKGEEEAFPLAAILVLLFSLYYVTWPKHPLNNWWRIIRPSFDNSLALEMFGFRLPDIQEELSAMQEKRPATFSDDYPV